MKKILTIIVVLVCNITLYSQTKTETKDWIIETYNSFKRTENQKNFIVIENDSLVFYSYFYAYTYRKVAIKDITSIQIKKRRVEEMEWYQIDLKTNNKIEVGKYENETYIKDYSNGTTLSILLKVEFGLDDYPKRMEKALLKIVSLYRGKAIVIKETF